MWQYSYREVEVDRLVQRGLQTSVSLISGTLEDAHVDLMHIQMTMAATTGLLCDDL